MPRPKRTKVAPSGPAPRSLNALENLPATKTDSNALTAPFGDLYDISDPEDRVATTARHVKRGIGRGNTVATQLARAKRTSAPRNQSEERVQDLAELEDVISHTQGDEIDIEISSQSSPEVEVGRREMTTPAVRQSAIKLGKFKRRAREPSILGRRDAQARSSSIASDLAEDGGLTSVGKKNPSIMALGDVHTRTGNPGVHSRQTAAMAPSSMALDLERRMTPAQVGSVLKPGNSKGSKEPNTWSINRKRPEYVDDDNDDNEDDFNPEDESTPLNMSRTKATMSSSGPSGSSSRKRKLIAITKPQSSPTQQQPVSEQAGEIIPATASVEDEEESENELPSSPQDALRPSIEGQLTPEPMSETMAPPQSSSLESTPEPELPVHQTSSRGRGRRSTRGRTPPPRIQDSPTSSPPSLTHSPNRPYITGRSKGKKTPLPPSTFSTAQLQALLPRRRQPRGQFDVPSSDDEVDPSGIPLDDDELSLLNVRARRQRPLMARTHGHIRKSAKAKLQVRPTAKPVAKRTYGRPNPASDKENQEVDPNDSLAPVQDGNGNGDDSAENSQELEARVGKELKNAARKFQEVDKWEMEFEDVTASSSSPKDAR